MQLVMAEEEITVLSTVVLPETTNEPEPSPTQAPKRRASSASSSASKRQRLDVTDSVSEVAKPAATKRIAGDVDERTRGKRLFGGLLGTLSQNSSSTAHRRRVDIEQKQRDKLKVQKEEDDEVKRQRLEELNAARRERQKIWDTESKRIQHDNQQNLARFLTTKTKPVLYYKPWELLPDEEDKIREQIEELDRKPQIKRNTSPRMPEGESLNKQRQDQQPPEDIDMAGNDRPPDDQPKDISVSQTVHVESGQTSTSRNASGDGEEGKLPQDEPADTTPNPKDESLAVEDNHASPDAAKDGLEEMVQGDEDAVLY